jgi:hypothetical protein
MSYMLAADPLRDQNRTHGPRWRFAPPPARTAPGAAARRITSPGDLRTSMFSCGRIPMLMTIDSLFRRIRHTPRYARAPQRAGRKCLSVMRTNASIW